MKLGFSKAEEDFRAECAEWLTAQMAGEFADIKGITTLTAKSERRKEWEQQLAAHKWSCIGWPEEWGGRERQPCPTGYFCRRICACRRAWPCKPYRC